jgi:TonB family protein
VRYWLWWAASVKFLVPFSLLALLGGMFATRVVPVAVFGDWPAALGRLAEPIAVSPQWTPLALALLGVWALGFAAVVGRWLVRALELKAVLRGAEPYPAKLSKADGVLRVKSAAALGEPALVGIVRPVLLLPRGIAERLSPAQLDAVVAHELSHLRRRDNLTAVVHMLVEAVFWFHPLVWWLGARLVEERERACDEAVVRAGHDGRIYAEGILKVCEHYVASTLECAAGVSGADLKRRVVEIARSRVMSALSLKKKVLLGTFALSTVIVPVIFGTVSSQPATQIEQDVMPLVRIAPDYPPEAIAAKLDGWVQLEFTVTEGGVPTDVTVVDSSSPLFEAPSVEALRRWRYAPMVQDGVPVARRGVKTIIRYQLGPDRV